MKRSERTPRRREETRLGGYVLATKGAPVAYGPEARFVFLLSKPVELAVYKQSS